MTTNLKLYFYLPKMIKLSIMSVLIIVIGLYCFRADTHTVRMLGVLEMILGIATLFVALKSLFNSNPQLVMDESGIIDNRILKKKISWNQIQKIELTVVTNQKVLKLIVSDTFKNENFKWLFAKTAAVKLNQNPKTVLLNLDQLKINYTTLNEFLASKDIDFIPNDINRNLTGVEKFLNKLLY